MRRYTAVSVLLVACLWGGLALAQTNSATVIPYIYRIKSDGCAFAPVARRQTGFQVQGAVGIVTALHGVADCQTISAVADDGLTIFTELVITAVDIDRDIAVLTSPGLEQLPAAGLVPSRLADTEILTATLRIVGYPLGLDQQDSDAIESVRDIEALDDVIPDAEEPADFIKRKSPALTIDVLNLQAQLLPGHSGAPLLDAQNGLVAVGDGGLRGGTVGRSWAIPWQAVALQAVAIPAVQKKLTELAAKDIAALAFSSTYPTQPDDTTRLAPYKVRVADSQNQAIANAEVLLTHSQGYEIAFTDSQGFAMFQLASDADYLQSQLLVEAAAFELYNKTVVNSNKKVGVEEVRLARSTQITPTGTTAKWCEFAFTILDKATEAPVAKAEVSVTLGSKPNTGYTDSTGYYGSKLPCDNPASASVRVRIFAAGYKTHSETVPLIGEIKEIMLSQASPPTPSPSPTATPVPSATPVPITTLAPTPIPQPSCQLTGVFASVWYENKERLGCNTSTVITSAITHEPFVNGHMIWYKLSDFIYVLPNDAYWSQHSNSWSQNENALPCDQAQQFGYPAMGFGKLWCTNEKVRIALGNPLSEELPNEFAQQQTFEGGFIFEIFGGKTIIIFEDGTWREN